MRVLNLQILKLDVYVFKESEVLLKYCMKNSKNILISQLNTFQKNNNQKQKKNFIAKKWLSLV